MKKIITLAILAAMLLSFAACNDNKNEPVQTTEQTTTAAVTEDPATVPTVITVDDVKAVIDAAKQEYAAAAEVELSDGTVMSAELKDPGITVGSIDDGTATEEQMANYAMYLVNIRRLVCDRLITAFPAGNTVIFSKSQTNTEVGDFIFLDPVAAGYDSAGTLFAEMIGEDGKTDIGADYVYIQNSVVALFDGETEEVTLLCPTDEENAVLAAIAAKLNPDMLTEQVTETSAVTE